MHVRVAIFMGRFLAFSFKRAYDYIAPHQPGQVFLSPLESIFFGVAANVYFLFSSSAPKMGPETHTQHVLDRAEVKTAVLNLPNRTFKYAYA